MKIRRKREKILYQNNSMNIFLSNKFTKDRGTNIFHKKIWIKVCITFELLSKESARNYCFRYYSLINWHSIETVQFDIVQNHIVQILEFKIPVAFCLSRKKAKKRISGYPKQLIAWPKQRLVQTSTHIIYFFVLFYFEWVIICLNVLFEWNVFCSCYIIIHNTLFRVLIWSWFPKPFVSKQCCDSRTIDWKPYRLSA